MSVTSSKKLTRVGPYTSKEILELRASLPVIIAEHISEIHSKTNIKELPTYMFLHKKYSRKINMQI